MNSYELTIVIPEAKDGKEKERIVKLVADFVKKAKGSVKKQESWGVKELAYPIKKLTVADYEYFELELEGANQVELDKSLRMDETILRYMFVRV